MEVVKLYVKIFPCHAGFDIHICTALYRFIGLIQNIQLIRKKFKYSVALEIFYLAEDFYCVNE